jgi:hypothetical protein
MAGISRLGAGISLFVAGILVGLLGDRLFLGMTRTPAAIAQVKRPTVQTKYFDDPLGLDNGTRSTSLSGPPKFNNRVVK